MNVHKNARMTVHGRLLLVRRVSEAGWRVVDAAAAAGVSKRTAYSWLARWRAGGEPALHDRSSAPARSPSRLPTDVIAAIERLRRQRWTGPRIARALGRPVSTVGSVLRRLGLGRLSALEAKPSAVRYERSAAGELLHIDTKKLGRIDGLGHRVTGDRHGHRARRPGWEDLHVAIDDASRLAYTELLPDERGPTCAGFLARAAAWFARLGVRIARVMTDNAFAYTRSQAFKAALAELGARHLTTRPYTPRTNGKAERFIQTALREWLYGRPYASSAARTIDMPARVPVAHDRVRASVLYPLDAGFGAVIDKEVDGDTSLPARIEANPSRRISQARAATRAARAVFLCSAPLVGQPNCGLTSPGLRLACAEPGDQLAIFGEALRELTERGDLPL